MILCGLQSLQQFYMWYHVNKVCQKQDHRSDLYREILCIYFTRVQIPHQMTLSVHTALLELILALYNLTTTVI